ncbi:MAG: hypothetical protein H6700_05785 [Myxococcales bacterium]|nr:hypothetical protein [Myxococcales bacterium]MCB9531257.1 hypothetical protein [Myxococcales bacterium]
MCDAICALELSCFNVPSDECREGCYGTVLDLDDGSSSACEAAVIEYFKCQAMLSSCQDYDDSLSEVGDAYPCVTESQEAADVCFPNE